MTQSVKVKATLSGMVESALRPVLGHFVTLGFVLIERVRLLRRHLGRQSSAEVLVQVIHEKFVRFIEPVMTECGMSFDYLVAGRMVDAASIAALGRDHAEVNRGSGSFSRPFPGRYLMPFRGLVELAEGLLETLSRARPKCVVICEGNSPSNEVLNRLCRLLRIPTVCVQQGWSPIVHSGFRNMSYSVMCLWGKRFEDYLAPFNPEQNFVMCGNHLLPEAPKMVSDERSRNICFFAQGVSSLLSEEMIDRFLQLSRSVALAFPDRNVFVREHPSYPVPQSSRKILGEAPNLHFVAARDQPLADMLSNCSLSVAIYSSTILESLASGVLPVIVNLTSLPRYYPDLAAEGLAVEVHTVEDAYDKIVELLRNDVEIGRRAQRLAQHRSEFFAALGRDALLQIAGSIRSTAERSRADIR